MIFGGLFNSYHSSYLSIYWDNIDLFVRLYLSWISLCTHHIYVIVALISSKDITFFIILRNILTKFFPSFLTLIISSNFNISVVALTDMLFVSFYFSFEKRNPEKFGIVIAGWEMTMLFENRTNVLSKNLFHYLTLFCYLNTNT